MKILKFAYISKSYIIVYLFLNLLVFAKLRSPYTLTKIVKIYGEAGLKPALQNI